jgi:hypothetical protein
VNAPNRNQLGSGAGIESRTGDLENVVPVNKWEIQRIVTVTKLSGGEKK